MDRLLALAALVAAVVLTLVAPSIDSVAVNDQRAFLPKTTASLDAIDVIKKEFPGHARKLMHGMWGSGQMSNTKTLVVFDDDVDIHDWSQCAWRAFANVDARRDLVVVEGPVDVLAHAAPAFALGAKIGVDATRKWAEEGGREWPEPCVHPPELLARMDALYARLVPGAPPPARPRIAPPPAAS